MFIFIPILSIRYIWQLIIYKIIWKISKKYILLKKIIIFVLFKIKKNININKKRYCNYNLKEHLFTASSGNFCIRSHSNEGPSSWRNRRKRWVKPSNCRWISSLISPVAVASSFSNSCWSSFRASLLVLSRNACVSEGLRWWPRAYGFIHQDGKRQSNKYLFSS